MNEIPTTMERIEQGIEHIAEVNRMDIKDFARMVAEHTGTTYNEECVSSFKYTGLANIDYWKMRYFETFVPPCKHLFLTIGYVEHAGTTKVVYECNKCGGKRYV